MCKLVSQTDNPTARLLVIVVEDLICTIACTLLHRTSWLRKDLSVVLVNPQIPQNTGDLAAIVEEESCLSFCSSPAPDSTLARATCMMSCEILPVAQRSLWKYW